jgi:DNA-binding transcriptional MerR regulator
MRKEVANNDDVSDVDLGDCWHSTDRAADCGNREAAEKMTLRTRPVNTLKVGQVAAEAGVGVQTLHYYERLGLLPKPNRSEANYRIYSPEAIRRVRFIKKAQALGLTLEETKQILDLKAHGREPCLKVAELGEKHLQEIDARLAQLRAYRRALAQAVSDWPKKNLSARKCAGEFCDLIERLPQP